MSPSRAAGPLALLVLLASPALILPEAAHARFQSYGQSGSQAAYCQQIVHRRLLARQAALRREEARSPTDARDKQRHDEELAMDRESVRRLADLDEQNDDTLTSGSNLSESDNLAGNSSAASSEIAAQESMENDAHCSTYKDPADARECEANLQSKPAMAVLKAKQSTCFN